MHGPINVKSPNNTSKWQMGFNSAFKGLNNKPLYLIYPMHIIILKINKFISLQNTQLKLTQMVANVFISDLRKQIDKIVYN